MNIKKILMFALLGIIIVGVIYYSGFWENTLLPWLHGTASYIPVLLSIICVACLGEAIYSFWRSCNSNHKERKNNKISAENAKDELYEILRLTSDDKIKLNIILSRVLKEDKQEEKEFDKQDREYWMYIWKIVYTIQQYYSERGYLEYAYNTLLEEKSMFDVFSENNLITAVSIALGILGIVGGKNDIDIAYISLMIIILIVFIENVRAVFEKNRPEQKKKRFYREIIEGVFNASKK